MPAYVGIQSPGVLRLDSRSRIKYGTSCAGMTQDHRNWQWMYAIGI
jgi:hypothetical protein